MLVYIAVCVRDVLCIMVFRLMRVLLLLVMLFDMLLVFVILGLLLYYVW